jgi:hypothetical protein
MKSKIALTAIRIVSVAVLAASILLPLSHAVADPIGCQLVTPTNCVDVHNACANSGYGRWCGEGTHGEKCTCNYPPN